MGVRLRKDNDMGNFGKKLLGMGALGAAAGAAAYYFVKKLLFLLQALLLNLKKSWKNP